MPRRASALSALLLALPLCAWAQTDTTSPYSITNLTATAGKINVVIRWTAPGDRQPNGATCAAYDIRYSQSPINDCNFTQATQFNVDPPAAAGTPECADINGLTCNHGYYFAVKTQDAAGNWSGLSNVVFVSTSCTTHNFPVCSSLDVGPLRDALALWAPQVTAASERATPGSGLPA